MTKPQVQRFLAASHTSGYTYNYTYAISNIPRSYNTQPLSNAGSPAHSLHASAYLSLITRRISPKYVCTVHVNVCGCVCVCARVCACRCEQVCACECAWMPAHVRMWACASVHVCAHAWAFTCMNVWVCARMRCHMHLELSHEKICHFWERLICNLICKGWLFIHATGFT